MGFLPGRDGEPPKAPSGPQLGPRGGPDAKSVLLPVLAALVAGVLVARAIDWRSHAHPRD
jgi:hypothetical protein